jgi:hypothetical protein
MYGLFGVSSSIPVNVKNCTNVVQRCVKFSSHCLDDYEVVRWADHSPHQNPKLIWDSGKFLREGHIPMKDSSASPFFLSHNFQKINKITLLKRIYFFYLLHTSKWYFTWKIKANAFYEDFIWLTIKFSLILVENDGCGKFFWRMRGKLKTHNKIFWFHFYFYEILCWIISSQFRFEFFDS